MSFLPCVLCVLVLPSPGIRLSDLDRFPSFWIVQEQIKVHREHLQWLSCVSRYYPASECDVWIRETRERLRYWETLWIAHSDDLGEWRLEALRRLWDQIGPDLYKKRWHPPLILKMNKTEDDRPVS